jgi:hypothetical protein
MMFRKKKYFHQIYSCSSCFLSLLNKKIFLEKLYPLATIGMAFIKEKKPLGAKDT